MIVKKYMQLLETTREEIFSCLRINPILVGINNSNSGFTKQFSEHILYFKELITTNKKVRLQTLFNTEFVTFFNGKKKKIN